jgi:hypothetical protein
VQSLGSTPAFVELPAGEDTLTVGSVSLCLVISPAETAFVRIRAGKVEEFRGARKCGRKFAALTIRNLEDGTVEGSGLMRQFSLQSFEIARTASLRFVREGFAPVALTLKSEPDDSIDVTLEWGTRSPDTSSRLELQPFPARPTLDTIVVYDPPPQPDSTPFREARKTLSSATRKRRLMMLGGILAIPVPMVMIASTPKHSPNAPALAMSALAISFGGGVLSWAAGASLNCDSYCRDGALQRIQGYETAMADYRGQLALWNETKRQAPITNAEIIRAYPQRLAEFAADSARIVELNARTIARNDSIAQRSVVAMHEWQERVKTRQKPIVQVIKRRDDP